MSVRNNYHRISLASIFICFFIPQVQGGFWDDTVKKVKTATEDIITDTANGMTNNNDKSSDSSSRVNTGTVLEEKKQTVKNSTVTETSSAVASVQTPSVTETAVSQHSDVDIIGLKLGMTQDQVVAALKKHNKDFDITFSESKVTANERKQDAHLPDHLQVIEARMGNIHTRPNETIIVRFSSPPSNNTVNEIVREVTFSQDTLSDTVVTALKEKYGTPTPKQGMLLWGFSINNEGSVCPHMMPYFGHQGHYHQSDCSGIELIAMVNTSQEISRGLTTVLIDHGEIKRQYLASHEYVAQLREERRQEKIKKASQGSAPTL